MDEDTMVTRIIAGDQEAFELMVNRYARLIHHVAYRMLDDQEEAADVTQETMLRAYRHLRGFRRSSKLSTWLTRIACNMCVDRLKKRSRYLPAEAGGEPVNWSSPEDEVIGRELSVTLTGAIAALPPRHRAAVILYHSHGLTYEQIAQALDCPVGTVKTHLFRARKTLRDILTAGGVDLD